jgi:hypothetical protein
VTLTKEVFLHDTAYLSNTTSVARSYYDTVTRKIVLQLTGKTFSVPLTIYKHTVQKSDVKEMIGRKAGFTLYLSIFFFGILIAAVILYFVKR